MKRKYGNKKVNIYGIEFDSAKEAGRYVELLGMVKVGLITDLVLQPKFVLVEGVKFAGTKRAKPAIKYLADFGYTCTKTGQKIVEDVKSSYTAKLPVYRIKKHLMLAIHGIEINEV